MRPFITSREDAGAHTEACGNKHPYILVSPIDAEYCEVFFDITNMPLDSHAAATAVARFSSSYRDFFMVSAHVAASYSDLGDYPFAFPVRRAHSEAIATQLFHYLSSLGHTSGVE